MGTLLKADTEVGGASLRPCTSTQMVCPIADGGPMSVIPEPPTVVWGTLRPPQVKAASDVSPPQPRTSGPVI